MEYEVKYRKSGAWIWKKEICKGHVLNQELNRMDLHLKRGGIVSITKWSEYDLRLGADWLLATKKQLEKEASQNINLD
jgi:hypothetical protein